MLKCFNLLLTDQLPTAAKEQEWIRQHPFVLGFMDQIDGKPGIFIALGNKLCMRPAVVHVILFDGYELLSSVILQSCGRCWSEKFADTRSLPMALTT
jgi:hypothetical protein